MAILLNSSGRRVLKDAGQRLGASGDPCCCINTCPDALSVTFSGVDASTPCPEHNKLANCVFGARVCLTGISSAIDGTYYLPRVQRNTTTRTCTYSAIFAASSSFSTRSYSGSACFGSSTTYNPTHIGVTVVVNYLTGEINEVRVLPLASEVDGSGYATWVAHFYGLIGLDANGYHSTVFIGDTHAVDDSSQIQSVAPFTGLVCSLIMTGGTFTTVAA
jgi:hypothetical protein